MQKEKVYKHKQRYVKHIKLKIDNTKTTNNWKWNQLLRKGKQFLRH